MPSYRLIFPVPEGTPIENAKTAHVDSGDEIWGVGAEVKHGGRLWRVTQAPLDQPENTETADLLVWPVD